MFADAKLRSAISGMSFAKDVDSAPYRSKWEARERALRGQTNFACNFAIGKAVPIQRSPKVAGTKSQMKAGWQKMSNSKSMGGFGSKISWMGAWFPVVMLLIAAIKMALIWGNETITEGSDSVEYMLFASKWFYGYDILPSRGAVFPLWVAFCSLFEVPLRLATEAFFITAVAAFAGSLPRIGIPRPLAAAIFAGVILNPATFLAFDMPMSEGLFAAITLGLLAALIRTITANDVRSRSGFAAVIGLAGALLLNERGNDAVLIYALLGASALAMAAVALFSPESKQSLRQACGAVVLVVLVAIAGNTVALAANYLAFGHFGSNEIFQKGQQRLIGSLVSIDTGEAPLHKWIPITNEALRIAYELSPTLASFRHAIEVDFRTRDEKSSYASFSRTGIKGQFDISEILVLMATVFSVPPATESEPPFLTAQRSDDLKMKMAMEVEEGLREGRAKKRFTVYIWNPTSPLLSAALKESASHIAASLFRVNTEILFDNFPPTGSIVSPLYDEMARRRLWAVSKGPLVGYLSIARPLKISSANLSNNAKDYFAKHGAPGVVDATIALLHAKGFRDYEKMGQAMLTKVLPGDLPSSWASPISSELSYYQFTVPAVAERFNLYFGRLTIIDDLGKVSTCDNLQIGPTLHADTEGADSRVNCLITAFDLRLTPWQQWGYAAQRTIRSGFNTWSLFVSAALLGFGVAGLLFRLVWQRGFGCDRRVSRLALLGVVASIVAARMIFFAFIDATIFPIHDDRHLFASNVLLAVLVLMSCYELSCGILSRRTD
jgi:hypothetical protein